MNIAIDVQPMYSYSRGRGIGRYAENLVSAIFSLDKENTYYLVNFYGEPDAKERTHGGRNVFELNLFEESKAYLGHTETPAAKEYFRSKIQKIIDNNKIDIFHVLSSVDEHDIYDADYFDDVKFIATLYDMIPLVYPDKYLSVYTSAERYAKCIEQYVLADFVVSDSNSAKMDAVKYIGMEEERGTSIYAGVSKQFTDADDSSIDGDKLKKRFGIHLPYVICVGGDDFRKNLSGLVEAFCQLPQATLQEVQLVIVCNMGEMTKRILNDVAEKYGCKDKIVITGYVSDEEMIYLLRNARLEAFPSMYEGFGLPVVEAWQCGVPVLTSDNSSLGEIAAGAAVLVDPFSLASIKEGLLNALTDADLKEYAQKGQAAVKKYTWPNVAESMLTVYRQVYQMPKRVLSANAKSKIRKTVLTVCTKHLPNKPSVYHDLRYAIKNNQSLRWLYRILKFFRDFFVKFIGK